MLEKAVKLFLELARHDRSNETIQNVTSRIVRSSSLEQWEMNWLQDAQLPQS